MKKIKAILVDDEQGARDVLSNLLNRFCPEVEVIATCVDVVSAVQKIKELNPDVVFLDIEMPNYAGHEIVSFFEEINFEIIFVTAYDKYAIKAFEVAAVDYLLKPIDIDRLKDAVIKLKDKIQSKNISDSYKVLSEGLETREVSKMVIPHNGDQKIILIKTIIAIEAQESYSCIHTEEGRFLVSRNLKHFESILSENPSFIRSHKSWLINMNFMIDYSKSRFEINLKNNVLAKLSKYKKNDFEARVLESHW